MKDVIRIYSCCKVQRSLSKAGADQSERAVFESYDKDTEVINTEQCNLSHSNENAHKLQNTTDARCARSPVCKKNSEKYCLFCSYLEVLNYAYTGIYMDGTDLGNTAISPNARREHKEIAKFK